jgi:hypothetical protein
MLESFVNLSGLRVKFFRPIRDEPCSYFVFIRGFL